MVRSGVQQLVEGSPLAAVVTDPRQPDNPIVAVNDAFCALTGYPRDEIIGRNCRFLAGEETEPWVTQELARGNGGAAAGAGRDPQLPPRRDAVPQRRDRSRRCSAPDGELDWFLGSQVDLGPADESARADGGSGRVTWSSSSRRGSAKCSS